MSGPILLILRLLMALALYSFLVGVLLILWQDMKRQSNLLSIRKVRSEIIVELTDILKNSKKKINNNHHEVL